MRSAPSVIVKRRYEDEIITNGRRASEVNDAANDSFGGMGDVDGNCDGSGDGNGDGDEGSCRLVSLGQDASTGESDVIVTVIYTGLNLQNCK